MSIYLMSSNFLNAKHDVSPHNSIVRTSYSVLMLKEKLGVTFSQAINIFLPPCIVLKKYYEKFALYNWNT